MGEVGRLLGAGETRRLLDEYGISPSRALAQNFLVDPNQVRKICRVAKVARGDRVVEIGPGLGALTRGLVAQGARVAAIEKDRRLCEVLDATIDEAVIICADAAEQSLSELLDGVEDFPDPWMLVANLPYNVGTGIFLDILETESRVVSGVVMLQADVADRLVARPGSKTYGVPSLVVEYYAKARISGRLGRDVFLPRPRVESALVSFERRESPPVEADPTRMFELIRTAFSKRRKTLKNAMSDLKWSDDAMSRARAAEIEVSRRPETLSLDEFAAIAGGP